MTPAEVKTAKRASTKLGDFTMTPRSISISLLAVIIGAVSAFVALGLRAVAHGGVTVAARDLLALDSPVHVRRRRQVSFGARSKRRRTVVSRFRIIVV